MGIKQRLAAIPTPLGGLALGISSLGWCWENFTATGGIIQTIAAVIGFVLLLTVLSKFVVMPRLLAQDLAHPVVGSVVPTTAMALMAISKAISLYSHDWSVGVWLFAIALHIVFLCMFAWHRLRDFQLHHMVPSWFIPPVGIVTAAVACPGGSVLWLGQALAVFGVICYLVMLPAMLYRLVFAAEVPDQAKPTLAILAAPASLSLAGYLTVMPQPHILMVGLLSGIAVLMTALIYLAFLRLMRLPFSPGYSAFTFPMVIGSTALYKLPAFLTQSGFAADDVMQVRSLANLELTIATLVVAYVSGCFIRCYLLKPAASDRLSAPRSLVK